MLGKRCMLPAKPRPFSRSAVISLNAAEHDRVIKIGLLLDTQVAEKYHCIIDLIFYYGFYVNGCYNDIN